MTMILISETNNNNYTMLITSNISGFIYYTNFWYLHRLYEPQVYLTVICQHIHNDYTPHKTINWYKTTEH